MSSSVTPVNSDPGADPARVRRRRDQRVKGDHVREVVLRAPADGDVRVPAGETHPDAAPVEHCQRVFQTHPELPDDRRMLTLFRVLVLSQMLISQPASVVLDDPPPSSARKIAARRAGDQLLIERVRDQLRGPRTRPSSARAPRRCLGRTRARYRFRSYQPAGTMRPQSPRGQSLAVCYPISFLSPLVGLSDAARSQDGAAIDRARNPLRRPRVTPQARPDQVGGCVQPTVKPGHPMSEGTDAAPDRRPGRWVAGRCGRAVFHGKRAAMRATALGRD